MPPPPEQVKMDSHITFEIWVRAKRCCQGCAAAAAAVASAECCGHGLAGGAAGGANAGAAAWAMLVPTCPTPPIGLLQDLAGQANLRPSWAQYYQSTHAVIVVADASDRCVLRSGV